MSLVIAIGVLAAAGTFLVARGGTVRLILGFILLGHAVNLLILAAGGASRREPAFIGPELDPSQAADPLPQAFVLTAIVITFGVTVFLLSLSARSNLDSDADRDDGEPQQDDAEPQQHADRQSPE